MKCCARFTPEERQDLLDKLQRSDLTISEFARQNGLSRPLLSMWLKRYVRQPVCISVPNPSDAQMKEVPLKEISLGQVFGPSPWAAELTLPGGISVRLDAQ